MKKIFLIIAALFCLALSSYADVIPRYTTSIKHTGIGTFNVPEHFTVYAEPDENSAQLGQISWSKDGVTLNNKQIRENDIFAAFIPSHGIAYSAVDDEIDGWVKIFYSQAQGKSGWVKTTAKNKFVSWMGFFMSYGRKNGVYFFKDMPDDNKKVMSAPSSDSQRLSGYTYPKFVKLTLVRGNWMLVTILDLGNETRVGWMQWRKEDGSFMIFPKLYKDQP